MKVKETTAPFAKKKSYTYRDYLKLPEGGNRYELLEGELVMTPAASTVHQRVSQLLEVKLFNYVEAQKLGYIFHAPIDAVFDAPLCSPIYCLSVAPASTLSPKPTFRVLRI